jgi:hypothetical protein
MAALTPASEGSPLSDAQMASAGVFGPGGRDLVVTVDLADRDSNLWRASGLYRVKTKVRVRTATGVGQAAAIAALLQCFVRNHAGRRWRLLGPQKLGGKVTSPRRRRKREAEPVTTAGE